MDAVDKYIDALLWGSDEDPPYLVELRYKGIDRANKLTDEVLTEAIQVQSTRPPPDRPLVLELGSGCGFLDLSTVKGAAPLHQAASVNEATLQLSTGLRFVATPSVRSHDGQPLRFELDDQGDSALLMPSIRRPQVTSDLSQLSSEVGVLYIGAGFSRSIAQTISTFGGDAEVVEALSAMIEAEGSDRTTVSSAATPPGSNESADEIARLALKLARTAIDQYVTAWKATGPRRGWRSHSVRLDPRGQQQLTGAISNLTEALSNYSGVRQKRLAPKALARRLKRLREGIQTGRLEGPECAWLADVLWHCSTFSSDHLPHPDEVSIQVSLLAEEASNFNEQWPWTHVETSLAVREADALETAVRTRYGPILSAMFSESKSVPVEGGVDRVFGDLARILMASPRRVRTVFYGGFDLSLERACLDLLDMDGAGVAKSFSVLIPVLMDGKTRGVFPTWYIGRYHGGAAPSEGDTRNLRDDLGRLIEPVWTRVGGDEEVDLGDGPVIVRLNGSPLHRLPKSIGRELKHRVTLREREVFEFGNVLRFDRGAAFGSSSLPVFLLKRLVDIEPNRGAWLALGTQWFDWVARSQLWQLGRVLQKYSDEEGFRQYRSKIYVVGPTEPPIGAEPTIAAIADDVQWANFSTRQAIDELVKTL